MEIAHAAGLKSWLYVALFRVVAWFFFMANVSVPQSKAT